MNVKQPDGVLIFAKRECETCQMVAQVIGQIADKMPTIVYTQDDPSFPSTVSALDDTSLESSYAFDVEAVPTVVRMKDGKEVARTFGWNRSDWEKLTGLKGLGEGLPAMRPGCGSKSREPGVHDALRAKYSKLDFKSRQIRLGEWDDEIEACFDRGWSDGLPVVPPTDVRILRMLEGTSRKPDEIIGDVPPNLSPITVEKVAINAVMAGCKPEYMPVVLAALEAALDPLLHDARAALHHVFLRPDRGRQRPDRPSDRHELRHQCLGQGNRANATIGRALQLIIRNVGGGLPGEIDRAVLGGPGKYTFCFAEDEIDPTWMPLSVARGIAARQERRHAFPRRWHSGFIDQRSRTPEQLMKSLAMSLLAVGHPKLCEFTNAMLVLVPEHYAIFAMPAGIARASPRSSTRRWCVPATTWSRARRASARASTRSVGRTR